MPKLQSRILLASFSLVVSFVYLIERDREIHAENAQQDKLLDHPRWLAPHVPTPPEVIDAMLKLATVRAGDILYDLGSGDGRIIIRAAEKRRANAVGIEFDEELCNVTRLAIRKHHLEGRVRVIQGDILEQDLSEASVVTAYLLPKSLGKIAPLLQTQLKKGARVLSVDDEIPGWKFTKRLNVWENSTARNWWVFLYVIR
ncbi:MAG: class I SAM-dependent methyltransferase [Acidobacteria bacterium]|nr:class I SAM-dependent methyltransferase [Acidobacteriota bacterium]MCI0624365.1 class I SAM-dependent methyltransferase [Acidobacteriota bacterium]MCI0723327.1 class I SAM-dependent methyltransferase [Acidobacteriota bacterium]